MLAAVVGFLISHLVNHVTSHGRLIEPPSRASMWRYGFNTPPNYSDHELYCGGLTKQWQVNGGKCGICGDPWEAKPRPHEAGGKYATGTIVRKYRAGSTFTIRVELTANHRGYFEFRLCPNNNVKLAANQECLDQYVLKRSRMSMREVDDQYHETRFYPGTENKVYEMKYKLPSDLTCTQCVLQWKYIADPTGGSGVQDGGWFSWIFALFDSIWHMFSSFLGGGGSRSLDMPYFIRWSQLPFTKKLDFLRLIRIQAKALGLTQLWDRGGVS